jgi:hypothetical protein
VEQTVTYVIFKKLFALKHLYSFYDYILCCDAEIVMLKTTGYYEMMKAVVAQRTICGGIVKTEDRVVRSTMFDLTPRADHERLRRLGRLKTWWSNVPVYDCKHVPAFLEWIQFKPSAFLKYSWYFFENMAYDYFCLLYCNYKLVVVPGIGDSLEMCGFQVLKDVNETKCKLWWVNRRAFRTNETYFLNNDFYIVFHFDR